MKFKKSIITEKWFEKKINILDALNVIAYRQCKVSRIFPGFVRKISWTKITVLSDKVELIRGRLSKKTQYEIRRAEKAGFRFVDQIPLGEFILFFNCFSRNKGMNVTLNERSLIAYEKNLRATKVTLNDVSVVMHLYLCDFLGRRSRLLYSASLIYEQDSKLSRNMVGYANRYLHFEDMCMFGTNGFIEYDIGGYAKDTKDPQLIGINSFKEEFGGELVEEGNYYSILYIFLNGIKSFFNGVVV